MGCCRSFAMGNCSLKGMTAECEKPIRVLTDSGNIINFHGTKQVNQILKDYPAGYGVFQQANPSSPLSNTEFLHAGKSYFLLPLNHATQDPGNHGITENGQKDKAETMEEEEGKEPSKRSDVVENLADGSGLEVLPAGGDGVWRVKLVIDTKQLEQILAEEVNTEALIERMRAAASLAATRSPRRAKRSWGENWKPTFASLFHFNPKSKDFNSGIGCLYPT